MSGNVDSGVGVKASDCEAKVASTRSVVTFSVDMFGPNVLAHKHICVMFASVCG